MTIDRTITECLRGLGLGHRSIGGSYDPHEIFDLETGVRFALMDARDAVEFFATQEG